MNKKGYTLLEILLVVAIIATIGLVGGVNLVKTINASKQEKYDNMVIDIQESANTYLTINPELEAELYTNGTYTVPIAALQEALLIDEKLKNPKDNTLVDGTVLITYNSSTSSLEYEVTIIQK